MDRQKRIMEKERKILLSELNKTSMQHILGNILNNIALNNPKSAEASARARKKGNDLLLHKKKHNAETHKAIFSHYCESVAFAPIESQELAFAYANRSYLLLHMQKYEDCVKDIDQALKMSISDVLKAKLLCRKAECCKRLGTFDISSTLEMIQDLTEKIDGQDRVKLLKTISKVQNLAIKEVQKSTLKEEIANDYDLPLTDDYSSYVSIEFNEKFGRHLLATIDYKPGDIIFVEKLYAAGFVEGSSLSACDHCMKHTWSNIPCNYCNWAMYCSESCREEAWNMYHDIECCLVSHLKECSETNCYKYAMLPIRILIIGIKENGTIANLKKELELLDQDGPPTVSFKNNQFGINNIQNVYSLASYAPHEGLVDFCAIIPAILISLTKYSKLKDNFNVNQVEDLTLNEDIVFLGSLLIKITAVLNANAFGAGYDNLKFTCKKSETLHFEEKRCLSLLFSLLNHSCFPTAEWCCTEDNKIIVYALQPIKKDSQIFIRYRYGFEKELQSVRQAKFSEKYNFTCECRACIEEWPPIKMNVDTDDKEKEKDVVDDIDRGDFSLEDLSEIMETMKEGRQIEKSHIEKLSSLIARGIHWTQPSHMFCNLITFVVQFFTTMYSRKPLVFDNCIQK